jgi:integrase
MKGQPMQTATFPTRRMAERWAKVTEGSAIEGKYLPGDAAKRRTFGEAIDLYTEDELPKKRGKAYMHRAALAWWKDALGDRKLGDITTPLLMRAQKQLARSTYTRAQPDSPRSKVAEAREYPRSGATVNRYFAVGKRVFNVARKAWGLKKMFNPFDDVDKLTESKGRIRYLSDDEREALLKETAKDAVLHAFVVIALSTACRAGELRKLKWQDVDLPRGLVTFQETKNDEPRSVWLHGDALKLLREHAKVRKLRGVHVFENASGRGLYDYRKGFMKAVAAAKLEGVVFHVLRHTSATYLAQAGVTERQLRAIGGWKSNAADVYVHLAADEQREALERLAERLGNDAHR